MFVVLNDMDEEIDIYILLWSMMSNTITERIILKNKNEFTGQINRAVTPTFEMG